MWAQICVQHMAQLANEATAVRCVVEPMFSYFDIGKHWSPVDGLALAVLRNVQLLMAGIFFYSMQLRVCSFFYLCNITFVILSLRKTRLLCNWD